MEERTTGNYPLHDGHEIGRDEYGAIICLTCWRMQGFDGPEPNLADMWIHRQETST